MAEEIAITMAHAWSSPPFNGWSIDVTSYEHNPAVELDVRDMWVADFVPMARGDGTSFLLVGLDSAPTADAPIRLLEAIASAIQAPAQ